MEMPNYKHSQLYKIVNNCNEMIYIGATTQKLSQRMCEHRIDAKRSNDPFHQAMKTLGIGNFSIVLIKPFPCKTKEELFAEEVRIMQTYNRHFLYNDNIGGLSDQTKKKISAALQGENSPSFKRGSIYYDKLGKSWKYKWNKNGKTKVRAFTIFKYGNSRAKRLCKKLRNYIFPL